MDGPTLFDGPAGAGGGGGGAWRKIVAEIARLMGYTIVPFGRVDPSRPPIGWYDDDLPTTWDSYIYILKDRLAELAGGSQNGASVARQLFEAGVLAPRKRNGRQLHWERLPEKG